MFCEYKKKRQFRKMVESIRDSGLFDYSYYMNQVDTALSEDVELDLIKHYIVQGARKGFKPNPLFDPSYYLSKNSDVSSSGCDPFYHYLIHGAKEGRQPHPLFFPSFLRSQINDGDGSLFSYKAYCNDISPCPLFDISYYHAEKKRAQTYSLPVSTTVYSGDFIEFLEIGWKKELSPHILFYVSFYLNTYPAVRESNINPLYHYVALGSFDHNPHPLFDTDYYIARHQDVVNTRVCPLIHFIQAGEKEKRAPSLYFDVNFYRRTQNVPESDNALQHFLSTGWKTGANPSKVVNFSSWLTERRTETSADDLVCDFFTRVAPSAPSPYINPEVFWGLWRGEFNKKPSVQKFLQLEERFHEGTSKNSIKDMPVLGLSYYGPLDVVSGLGTASRGYIEAMEDKGVVLDLHCTSVPHYQERCSLKKTYAKSDWPIALAQVNTDSVYGFFGEPTGIKFLSHDYRIGLWVWELPSANPEWWVNNASFDELWVPSSFCQKAFSSSTDIPVVVIPYVVKPPLPSSCSKQSIRGRFGIPENSFVYVYAFDASSYVERKNPFALVDAFLEGFSETSDASLVLKISYSSVNKDFQERLNNIVKKTQKGRLVVVDSVLSDEEMRALFRASDCYVSPHRSEGFGLTCAEAMSIGIPVVATDFGGTVDFVTEETGYPVNYGLVEIEEDVGPYKAGSIWAEIEKEHLVERMKEARSKNKVTCARQYIETMYSPEVVGDLIVNRLSKCL